LAVRKIKIRIFFNMADGLRKSGAAKIDGFRIAPQPVVVEVRSADERDIRQLRRGFGKLGQIACASAMVWLSNGVLPSFNRPHFLFKLFLLGDALAAMILLQQRRRHEIAPQIQMLDGEKTARRGWRIFFESGV
jgi:hypothetical protein